MYLEFLFNRHLILNKFNIHSHFIPKSMFFFIIQMILFNCASKIKCLKTRIEEKNIQKDELIVFHLYGAQNIFFALFLKMKTLVLVTFT